MIEVKILGPGCKNCNTTKKLIEEVSRENGIKINIEKIEDIEKIMFHGIMSTPGVIIDGEITHSGGIPNKKTILSWFK